MRTLLFILLSFKLIGQTHIDSIWKQYNLYQPSITLQIPNSIKTYKLNKYKAVGFCMMVTSGVLNGIRQGYEFDGRTSFERKYHFDPYGYFGSLSWTRRYVNGIVNDGVKPLYKYFPVPDLYHTLEIMSHTGFTTGGIVIGIGSRTNKKPIHYLMDFGLAMAVNMVSIQIGYYYVRH